MTRNSAANRRYPQRHPLNRGRGNEPNHLGYWHLEQQTIFPRCQFSRAGNGGLFSVSHDCWRLAKCSNNDVPQKITQGFPSRRSRHVFNPERGFTPSAVLANPSRS